MLKMEIKSGFIHKSLTNTGEHFRSSMVSLDPRGVHRSPVFRLTWANTLAK